MAVVESSRRCSSHPPALEVGWNDAAYTVQCRCGRREPKVGERGFIASGLAGRTCVQVREESTLAMLRVTLLLW